LLIASGIKGKISGDGWRWLDERKKAGYQQAIPCTVTDCAFCHFDRREKSKDSSHSFGMTEAQIVATRSIGSPRIAERKLEAGSQCHSQRSEQSPFAATKARFFGLWPQDDGWVLSSQSAMNQIIKPNGCAQIRL
jgi:hypothetical protein